MSRPSRIALAAFTILVLVVAGCGGDDEAARAPVAQPTDENVAEPPAPERTPIDAPVIRLNDKRFGDILATPGNRALYYWTVEKEADGTVRCTGSCAVAWPPLIVRSAAAVPKKIPGSAARSA